MGNILSYLRWRGDLCFAERVFNEVDNVVLAALSYLDFTGIVPSHEQGDSITIEEAAKLYFNQPEGDETKTKRLSIVLPDLLKALSESERFRFAKLYNYTDVYDVEKHTQFSALSVELDDGTVYIAYRGTDSSILGWREDFAMSFQETGAQYLALSYLESAMSGVMKPVRLGGHSKGGNLAMYAAMMCSETLRGNIIGVYNNDGPGFCPELPWAARYLLIREKTIRIIPEFSVVGMLFEMDKPDKIIGSSGNGLIQHDIMTWEVDGSRLVEKQDLIPHCKLLNDTVDNWIENVDMEHRKTFTDEFFDALGAGGADVFRDVADGGVDGFESILMAVGRSDGKTKSVIGKAVQSVASGLRKIDYNALFRTKATLRGAIFAGLGIVFMQSPDFALCIIGTLFFVGVLIFAGVKLVPYIKKIKSKETFGKLRFALFLVLFGLSLLFLLQSHMLTVSVGLLLGGALIWNAYWSVKRFITTMKKGRKRRWLLLTNAIVSLIYGLTALVTVNGVMGQFIFSTGWYLMIYGIIDITGAIYDNAQVGSLYQYKT